jgi:esterase/lipase superfamily enzyme
MMRFKTPLAKQEDFQENELDDVIPKQGITDRLAAQHNGKFNKREITSVKAVIAYQAYTHSISEDTVLSLLLTAFGVYSLEDFDQDFYDDVIRFLVDFNFEAAFN